MNPFGTRGRAEELARLLDGAVPAGTAVVLGAPALVARLRATGEALAPVTAPRAEFKAALRTRLVAVATVQAATAAAAPAAARPAPAPVSWAVGRRAPRAAGVAAGALASVVAVTGVAVAGGQSLPGDPFYGVKRTTEALQLRAADGALEKGNRHLDLAATRLREVRGLALGRDALDAPLALSAGTAGTALAAGRAPLADGAALGTSVAARVRSTLAAMDDETRKGTDLLTDAYRQSQAPEPLRALSRFATRQSASLEQLLPSLPDAARDRARVSLGLLTGLATETDELLGAGTCTAACDPASAAPPPADAGAPATSGATSTDPCGCPPEPAPTPQPAATGGTATDEPAASTPTPSDPAAPERPRPTPSARPTASPTADGGLPLPLPSLPLPLPEVPLPSLPPLPAVPRAPDVLPSLAPSLAPLVDSVLPGAVEAPGAAARPSADPAPTPVPTVAPAP